jgi:hypothetical protein
MTMGSWIVYVMHRTDDTLRKEKHLYPDTLINSLRARCKNRDSLTRRKGRIMLQKVHIKQNENEPHRVEILIDGVNIANRICGYTLTQEPGCPPVLEAKSNNVFLEFKGPAEVIDSTAREEIKRLKENNKVLRDALEEYQRKYGELE